ncbi:hypothetical protein [Aquitalea aquatica]|uniref:Uncharacterized protein n=1 Tax=Aquitalea aquatica TaxID=3044273 RepID=A0A838Y5J2_9NEIS|nr:hypothetical protein [Aquitalea magnusonii]MBA4707817.1 hypothetical protein [Aquitalea magnusonii]
MTDSASSLPAMPVADLQLALDAYLRLILRQGAAEQVLDERRQLLDQLLPLLDGVSRDAHSFRRVVERFVGSCAVVDRVTALTCAREFYYFWLGDVKKLVEITARSGFTTRNVRLEMADSLASLLERMQRQGFDAFPPSLEIYLGKLFEDGMAEVDIHEREMLLKGMLFLLSGQPYRPDSFRMVVDAMLLHLNDSRNKKSFVQLAREYFYYWLSFPPAHERIHLAEEAAQPISLLQPGSTTRQR